MPAVEINIENKSNIIKDARINFNIDKDYDLSLLVDPSSTCFFNFFNNGEIGFRLNWDKLLILDYPRVVYGVEPPFIKITASGNDIDELSVNAEKAILELYFNWNKDFLLKHTTDKIYSKFFLDEVDKTLYMSEVYSKRMDERHKWFNKVSKYFNKEKLSLLESKLNLIKDDFHQFAKIYDLSTIDVSDPIISFWDKYISGKRTIIENEHKHELKKYKLLKTKNELNSEFNIKIQNELEEVKKILKDKVSEISREISLTEECISNYESGEEVVSFFKKSLAYSVLNDLYTFNYNIEFINENGHLVIDFHLPSNEEVSNIKGYKEFKRDTRKVELYYNDKEYNKLYNSILYSLTFRLLRELFFIDYNSYLNQVSLNGWVNAINKKNGQRENKCIISMSVSKEKYKEINFQLIDLRSAFNDLKGISAVNLLDYTPIAPIVNLNKSDSRFVQSQEVLQNIDSGVNLASIDWEGFEHLVRELFEKEFAVNGGEVKVTQSSRDGGVDAVAFDPDPIRGGKIVIQSKRYTNVVGVSAVRDLYGTVMNEGATKGIIVTTSHYGNDAYEFAKGKPLTLLDGNNLLSLLQKHGYNARINIEEAKKLNKGAD